MGDERKEQEGSKPRSGDGDRGAQQPAGGREDKSGSDAGGQSGQKRDSGDRK